MKKIGDITNTADKNGEFTDGNVAAGTPPTQLMGEWFNSVQREILNVLSKAGVPQSADKENQLAEAITKIIAGAGYLTKNDLGNSATRDVGTTAGTVAAGNDSRIINAIPNTRTVNSKALSTNITLTAADVGAVPTTRTINGKSLLTDLILTAADLGITIPKNTALLDTNGWWKCGDTGWIIQWGIVPAGASNTLNHPLPTQFPNKGLWALGQSYWAMPYGEDSASGSAQLLSTAPNTTIRVTTDNGVPTAWAAIGC